MLMILPIGIIILVIVLIAVIFLYVQISVQIFDMKSNIFYLAESSIDAADIEKMAYRDYELNMLAIKQNIDMLLEKNYLYNKNTVGITDIKCTGIKIISSTPEILKHTNKVCDAPVICVTLEVTFNPLISFLGREIKLNIHDDFKLSLLEFKV